MPHRKSLASNWRRINERYQMAGNKCTNCSRTYFPAKEVCPTCRRKGKMEPFKISGKGTIESFTRIFAAPHGFENEAPYYMAIVKLAEGPSITAQVIENGIEIRIGAKVEAEFRKISEDGATGIINYGYKFNVVE